MSNSPKTIEFLGGFSLLGAFSAAPSLSLILFFSLICDMDINDLDYLSF
jgi:hypothetical protein